MEAEYYKRYEPFFGGWYIRQLIGEGGYGKVFEIERRDTLGAVFTSALKVITIPPNNSGLEGALSEGMDSESASVYFLDCVKELNREITLMSKLKGHSNIVSYEDHDIIQHEDGMGWDILIRMELLTPITKLLKDNHVFSCEEVIRLGIDLCHALELCQRYGIIHRDIKPANIFLSAADDFKLGDFGVARVTNAATAAYTRVGTLNYMAPEIFAGQPYSSNVDIYSLGLVMYQLLNANRMPFYPPYPETITYAAQERAHARRLGGEKLPAPANAPEHLAKIVLRACAPNPADRYQTAAQMRQELEALQKQEPNVSGKTGETIILPDPVSPEPDPTTKTVVLPDPSKKEPKPEGPTSTAPTKKVKPKATTPDEPKKKKISRRQLLAALGGTAAVAALAVGVLGRKSSSGPESGVSGNSGECGENAEWNVDSAGILTIRGTGIVERSPWRQIKSPDKIRRAVVEDGITILPDFAFSGLTALADVSLPEKLTRLGDYIFSDCTALKTVALPAEVTFIGTETFSGCSALESAELPAGITALPERTFWGCESLKTVTLPAGIEQIGEGSFWKCGALASVTLPESVSSIGAMAFAYCTALSTITLPSGLTALEDEVFWGCSALQTVVLPDGLESIGEQAFDSCSMLQGIALPASLTSIGASAFENCAALESIAFPDGLKAIGEAAFKSCKALKAIELPASATSIGPYAFAKCSTMESAVIHAGIKTLEEGTFYCCTALQTVVLPDGLQAIGEWTFYECKYLPSITLPESLQTIGENAFANCESLESVSIPANMSSIGKFAFNSCDDLKAVTVSAACSLGEYAFPKSTEVSYY